MSVRDDVLREIREGEQFLLVTHENPDGDALGSLLGMHKVLLALGKDSVMLMSENEFPLPREYRSFESVGIETEAPDDIERRTIIFLDCGNEDRTPLAAVKYDGAHTVNIDHHHDNTCFGTFNLVVGRASCTAEIIWSLLADLGVELTREIAHPLYIALITDTGKFMYENTGPDAHRMAADLIEAGVDVQAVNRRMYEGLPEVRLKLLAIALVNMRRFDNGSLTMTSLSLDEFAASGAVESDSDGVVDHLRSVEGTKVAAFVRELPALENGSGTRRKVSLRSGDGTVDVSVIARELGGGGHRQAAGASTQLGVEEVAAVLRAQIAAQAKVPAA